MYGSRPRQQAPSGLTMINTYIAEATVAQSTRTQRSSKSSKPCHVGIYWIALAKYSRMSTHLPGLQSFSWFLHHFVTAKLATSSIRYNRGKNILVRTRRFTLMVSILDGSKMRSD